MHRGGDRCGAAAATARSPCQQIAPVPPAKYQVATVAQGKGERVKHALPQLLGEIDQHIAAEHQVNPREGHLGDQIVLAEDDQIPHARGDLVGAIRADKATLDQLGRESRHGRRRVDTSPGEGERAPIYVGREDAHGEVEQLRPKRFHHQQRQRVCLLVGGAAGRPEPQFAVPSARLVDEGGEHVCPQVGEELRVTVECSHLDQKSVGKLPVLFRVGGGEPGIAGEVCRAGRGDALLQSPLERGGLVGAEVEAVPGANLPQERVEHTLFRRFSRRDWIGEQCGEECANARRRGNEVNGIVGQGERPAGPGGVLRDDGAPRQFDGPGAACAGIAENYRDQLLAEDLGGAGQQRVEHRAGTDCCLIPKDDLGGAHESAVGGRDRVDHSWGQWQ
jgi:hypothetical protein